MVNDSETMDCRKFVEKNEKVETTTSTVLSSTSSTSKTQETRDEAFRLSPYDVNGEDLFMENAENSSMNCTQNGYSTIDPRATTLATIALKSGTLTMVVALLEVRLF